MGKYKTNINNEIQFVYFQLDKMICLKNLCRRLERAEFYSFYPIPCFLVIMSLLQVGLFCFHKHYYSQYFGKQYVLGNSYLYSFS